MKTKRTIASLLSVLLLLSALCRLLVHAIAVRRVGTGTTVLVGLPGDPLLVQRAAAALTQSRLGHLERTHAVIVLDCGVSKQTAEACRAAFGSHVLFLQPDALASYLMINHTQN